MRITKLILPVSNIDAASHFFCDVLQLPSSASRVTVGWSDIELVESDSAKTGGVHLAFNVPFNRFAEARSWLLERCALQTDPEGRDIFNFDESWSAKSIYFAGPDESILELIARERLNPSSANGSFHGSEIQCVSEVGLTASNVPAACLHMTEALGVQPLGTPGEYFAALGDDEGLLIVADRARRWFPEGRQLPSASGLEVQVRSPRSLACVTFADDGWTIRSQ